MKILVIGRSGQLAMSLAERARARSGVDLVTAGRPNLDLECTGSVAKLIAAVTPDLVINSAAFTAVDAAEDSPKEAFRINAEAAGEVAAACATVGCRLIHLSTDYVFDGSAERPYREGDVTAPLGVYGRSKLAGEEAVQLELPSATIVRTSWIYSPFGKNFVRTMMQLADERDEVAVVDDQHGNPTSALDLSDALLEVAAVWQGGAVIGSGQIYHVTGGGAASWFGLASAVMETLAELGRPDVQVRPLASADWPTRAQRPLNSRLDSTKFRGDFGLVLPAWTESVRGTVRRLSAV